MQNFQILATLLLGTATAQQLPNYKYDYDFLPSEDITPTCKAALSKVLDCDTLLARYGPEGIMPSVEQMANICTATCHNSLIQFKKNIQKACPMESNIIHWSDGSNFTVTDNINEFIDRYNKLCLIDPETGRFCYDLFREWKETKKPVEYTCSDCVLGLYQVQKESRAAYDEGFAFIVASYIDTCETTSVSLSIMKGTPTVTGTSASAGSSGAETTPVVMDASTEVAPTTSPEIPVLTPMSSDGLAKTREETPTSSSETEYTGTPIPPDTSNGWAGLMNTTQSVTTSSLAGSTTTSLGGVATLMTIRLKDKSQLQKVL